MKIRILSAATRDLRDGHRFYEREAAGVGTYFLDSLYADIDSLAIHAGTQPVYFGRYHRLLSRHFPFAVYYRVAGDVATVTRYSIVAATQPGRANASVDRARDSNRETWVFYHRCRD